MQFAGGETLESLRGVTLGALLAIPATLNLATLGDGSAAPAPSLVSRTLAKVFKS